MNVGPAVPARQPAAAELQVRADRLSRPRSSIVVSGDAGAAAERAAQAGRPRRRRPSGRAGNLDFELELGIWIGPGNELGDADPDRRGAAHIAGLLPAERLVGARHPGLGVPAARPVPGQELRDDDLALGRHARSAGAVPHRAAAAARRRSGAAALPARRRRPGRRRARPRARGAAADAAMRRGSGWPPQRLSPAAPRHLYWTVAQMVAHHSSNGCNLRPGDLLRHRHDLGADADGFGSLLEITQGGRAPIDAAERRDAHASSRTATR